MQVEILITRGTMGKGRELMEAVHAGAIKSGIDSSIGWLPRKPGAYVVLYGLGGADRAQYAKSPNVISFDMGYWDRKGPDRKYRVSIGGFHCPKLIFKGPDLGGREAPKASAQVSREGPIMLVGNGPKSEAIGANGWSARRLADIRKAFPGRQVLYRPKPKRPVERGVVADIVSTEPIQEALEKVSLVVCRHSNVAVDACQAGVPVVCDDGAAASIYPAKLEEHACQPSQERRQEFLSRLAYWQWSQSECATGHFWTWIRGVL